MPFTGGSVRFFLLDRESPPPATGPGAGPGAGDPGAGDPGGAGTPEPEKWVPQLLASSVPALYSDNRAMLSAELSKKGAAVIDGSFDGFMPAGVVYQLTYVGLQPAFDVRVEADWQQVYHHMFDKVGVNVLFFTADVESMVDKLVDDKVITFKGTIEGVGDEGMEGQFNEVRKLLQEWVIDKFFTPVPNPDQPDDHPVENRILDTLDQARTLGSPVSVGLTHREIDMTELRSLSVDYSIARAVERWIAPQGHLSVVLADAGVTRDEVITVVKGSDDAWRSVDFTVTAAADFGPNALTKIDVEVWYGDSADGVPPHDADIWTVSLDAQNPVATRSEWFEPDVGTSFLYRYTGIFAAGAVVGQGVTLDSGWRRGEGARLTVVPDELYTERTVEFTTSALLPAALFPEVLVHLRYRDPGSGWLYQDTVLLAPPDTRSHSFVFRTRQGAPSDVEYRLSYFQAGDDPLETDWTSTGEPLVVVGDPRRNLFKVRVVVGGDTSRIRQLLLDLQYVDDANGVFEESTLQLDASQLGQAHEWVFHRLDPRLTRYSYAQTVVDVDGAVTTTGWVQEDKPTLLVGELYARQWTVRPQLVGPPLSDHGIAVVRVHLAYDDETNDCHDEHDLAFSALGAGEPWQLHLKDPSLRDYTCAVTYVTVTGVERRVPPTTASDTFLVVSSVPPP